MDGKVSRYRCYLQIDPDLGQFVFYGVLPFTVEPERWTDAAVALAAIDDLPLDGFHPFHAVRADLLVRADRPDEAAAAYDRAIELATNDAERTFLVRRRAEVATGATS